MIFQVLDDKGECIGIYQDGELYFSDAPEGMEKTWSYSSALKDLDIQYASIYAGGKKLEEVCPPELKREYERVSLRIKAHVAAFKTAKLNPKENCIYDLIPHKTLKEFCELKNRICEHVFQTYPKPKEYEYFKSFGEFIGDISARDIKLNRSWLSGKLYDIQAQKLWEKINSIQPHIKYDQFGSVTGRLVVTEDSFPILNLNKKLREVIVPQNDWFVEFDLNAAELRTAMALLGKTQPAGDLHEWSAEHIFRGELNRTEAKETATSWLYNSTSKNALKYDSELNAFYNKPALLAMYHLDGKVHTPFGREIECDTYHAISYLNQSTLIDLFHRQILKANSILDNKKSFISFLVHDSLVLDLSEKEKSLLPDFIRTLSDTKWGIFPVNVKIGRNYGEMKKIKIKV
jgi:hypothetical protein